MCVEEAAKEKSVEEDRDFFDWTDWDWGEPEAIGLEDVGVTSKPLVKPGPEEVELNPNVFISREDRAPAWDPFTSPQPVWQWQGVKKLCKFFVQGKCKKGDKCSFSHDPCEEQWKDFSPEDSVDIDRYYKAYEQNSEKYACNIKKTKTDTVIDFQTMTQFVKGISCKIRRTEVVEDWLNNAVFFEVFCATLKRCGVSVESDPLEMFDFSRNQDFRNLKDDGTLLKRGGRDYKIPCGWKRVAVKSLGKYDNNAWLRDGDGGWAVAYHGTNEHGLAGVLSTGFQVGSRQKFQSEVGKGIYCTYDINVAAHYSKPISHEGEDLTVVLQLRVRPEAIKEVKTGKTKMEKKYWVVNDPKDVRAYGVLIRRGAFEGGGAGGGGCCTIQ
jgi:hypothetical protein